MSDGPQAMIYGANGYTGRLIAAEAVRQGLKPILAGRNRNEIEALVGELKCASRVFGLDDATKVAAQLEGVKAIVNCAGPFSKTATVMMEACLRAKTHYLDITGEIDVLEAAAVLDNRAKEAGVAIVPAVGFDVVPSDCLAAMLAEKLPSATSLLLAFSGGGSVSPGTAKTALESMPGGGRVRIDGEIRRVPPAWKTREVPFRNGPQFAETIPWGDVSTAWHSTHIPNIEVYAAASPTLVKQQRRLLRIAPLLKFRPFRRLAEWYIDWTIPGPSASQRAQGRTEFWGQVSDAQGRIAEATLETPEGYTLTSLTAVACLRRVLEGAAPLGFSTPSRAFGKEFILSIHDVDFRWER
ncbi:MAG TPA: saccharopine dehydrogenase NADP-binding domain-containing protein [Pirellulales bacterium]|nr:saccharopine dehydrogenase NADP-binding domain-containing protein [Pirellulales bacterium]